MKGKQKGRRTLQQALLAGRIKFAGHVEVRGGYYHEMWEARVDKQLTEGAWLRMEREPENLHDGNSIAVYAGERMVGYVAKEKAAELAPFMDIGVKMALRVLNYSASPMRLTARLYIKR